MAEPDSDVPPSTGSSETIHEESGPSEPNVKQDDALSIKTVVAAAPDPEAAFDVLLERLPPTIDVPKDEIRAVIADLIQELPDGWSTPRHVIMTAAPYDGRAGVVQRLISADLSASTDAAAISELLRDRVVPTLRRLEREDATREEITDIVVEVIKHLPPSESRAELVRNAARYLLAEPDPDRKTANYYLTMNNLGAQVAGESIDATLESSALFERALLGMRELQQKNGAAFPPDSVEARQVRIGAHNLATGMLKLAQMRRDRSAPPSLEARRLEVLVAAYDSFDRSPSPSEVEDIAHRVGLTPFMARNQSDGPPDGEHPADATTAESGLLVVQAVGSVGLSSELDESVHDASASAISACCDFGWSNFQTRSAHSFFNANVTLGRLADLPRVPAAERIVLLSLATGAAFTRSDVSEAVIQNNALNIGAALAERVASHRSTLSSTAASLVQLLSTFAEASGLASPDAGQFRGDAVRLVEAAARVGSGDRSLPDDVPAEIVARAANVCNEYLEGVESIRTADSDRPADWTIQWVADLVGAVFSGPLDPTTVDEGLLWNVPDWIAQVARPRDRLLAYSTHEWREAPWTPVLVYAGQATDQEWELVSVRLDAGLPSLADALERYL